MQGQVGLNDAEGVILYKDDDVSCHRYVILSSGYILLSLVFPRAFDDGRLV